MIDPIKRNELFLVIKLTEEELKFWYPKLYDWTIRKSKQLLMNHESFMREVRKLDLYRG